MPVRLRLARVGVRNTPAFHVVAIRSSKRTTARPIEQLGSYDPVPKLRRPPAESVLDGIQEGSMQKALVINRKRVLYWLGVGAQPSDSVKSLLRLSGIEVPEREKKPRTDAASLKTSLKPRSQRKVPPSKAANAEDAP